MRTLRTGVGILAMLIILPSDAAARKQVQSQALAPDQLVTIRFFLTAAERSEVTLLTGVTHRGKIEAVTETKIVLKFREQGRGPWRMQAIATHDIDNLRLFHANKRGAKARAGRTLGLLAGLVLAGPAVATASRADNGIAAWAAVILLPGLGAMAGERIASPTQETLISVLRPQLSGF